MRSLLLSYCLRLVTNTFVRCSTTAGKDGDRLKATLDSFGLSNFNTMFPVELVVPKVLLSVSLNFGTTTGAGSGVNSILLATDFIVKDIVAVLRLSKGEASGACNRCVCPLALAAMYNLFCILSLIAAIRVIVSRLSGSSGAKWVDFLVIRDIGPFPVILDVHVSAVRAVAILSG